jgi:hypothetical protein
VKRKPFMDLYMHTSATYATFLRHLEGGLQTFFATAGWCVSHTTCASAQIPCGYCLRYHLF